MVYLRRLVVGPLMANCYLVGCEATKEGVIIDPGAEAERILKLLQDSGLKIAYIINTHGHLDHIGANREVREGINPHPPILIHEDDGELLDSPDRLFRDGDKLKIGQLEMKVLHTPGHTPGGISLLCDVGVFTGDTLFAGSIGRTDLPGGSHRLLLKSIRERILSLSDRTTIYPGHGDQSTIGRERAENPFLENSE